MKRPQKINQYDKSGRIVFTVGNYEQDLEKYIDFLESKQKEFVEWLEYNTEGFGGIHRAILEETLTKYKELNKNND